MADKKKKLLTKKDLREDDRPTGPLDSTLKAPIGSGFFKPMAAYYGVKLFGDRGKKEKYENIDGMKLITEKGSRGRKAGSSAEKTG
jgi:hypothetical protein